MSANDKTPEKKPCPRPGCGGTMVRKMIHPVTPLGLATPIRDYDGWECQEAGCWYTESR
jgi:hypothetical protein